MTETVAQSIRRKLTDALEPAVLEIEDDSARHAGHAGMGGHARAGGETHFNIRIVSKHFAGLSRVQRQRKVYEILAMELASEVHALSLATLTPDEAAA